jgi:hypothetical protein
MMNRDKVYVGAEFAEPFYTAMAEWYKSKCVGPDPRMSWEMQVNFKTWSDYAEGPTKQPDFYAGVPYRWKPLPKRTITLGYKDAGGGEHWETLVAPETVAPAVGTRVWYTNHSDKSSDTSWVDSEAHKELLAANNVFLREADAKAMADFQRRARGGV